MVADPLHGHSKNVMQKTVEDVLRLVTKFIIPHALEFYRTAENDSSNGDRLKNLQAGF